MQIVGSCGEGTNKRTWLVTKNKRLDYTDKLLTVLQAEASFEYWYKNYYCPRFGWYHEIKIPHDENHPYIEMNEQIVYVCKPDEGRLD